MTTPHQVLLDTDPGIDDALAILLGLASPEIRFVGLSVVHGNCPLSDALQNALDVLALGGAPALPVASGCAVPLLRPPFTALETHGMTGLGYARLPRSHAAPVSEHAVDLLIREIMAAPGRIDLVAVGPLTNVALALRKEPRIIGAVRSVIIMGGALRVEGNTTPLAEFNIYADPHAAQIVLASGMPITLMPWDITRDVRMAQSDVERLLDRGGPIPRFIADATRFYIEFHRQHFGFAACSINDPAALALIFRPDLAKLEPLHVAVETQSELAMGKTIGDFLRVTGNAPNVQLVTRFDAPAFIELFLERIERLIALTPAGVAR